MGPGGTLWVTCHLCCYTMVSWPHDVCGTCWLVKSLAPWVTTRYVLPLHQFVCTWKWYGLLNGNKLFAIIFCIIVDLNADECPLWCIIFLKAVRYKVTRDCLPLPKHIQCQPHLEQPYTNHCLTVIQSKPPEYLTTDRMRHLWMPFYSFVLSVPHCRSIQIVCSVCYTWCYRIIIQKSVIAVQYSMYLNVCCAININVYNIFL